MRETVTTTPVVEDDVVERLRQGTVQRKRRWSGDTHMDEGGPCDEEATDALMSEAAALIERLQKELETKRTLLDGLMKAVEPFAIFEKEFARVGDGTIGIGLSIPSDCEPTVGDLRRAREAYEKAKADTQSHKDKEG
jgi:hypothetical protein